MNNNEQFTIGTIKKRKGFGGLVEQNTANSPQSTGQLKILNMIAIVLLVIVIALLIINILMPASHSNSESFIAAFPENKINNEYGEKDGEKINKRIELITQLEDRGDNKNAKREIAALIILLKEIKKNRREDYENDKLYKFCVEKSKSYGR